MGMDYPAGVAWLSTVLSDDANDKSHEKEYLETGSVSVWQNPTGMSF